MTPRRFSSIALVVVGSILALSVLPAWAAGGDPVWLSKYSGPGESSDAPVAVAFSPDGSRVFVTGTTSPNGLSAEWVTLGLDAATGSRLWGTSYRGPSSSSFAAALTVSPDGGRVYVTGTTGKGTGEDYATFAYDAATGVPLWGSRYDGPTHSSDIAAAIVASPDGSLIFVTGRSVGRTTPHYNDYATVAYDASTGARVWVRRYNGPANREDAPVGVAVSPDSSIVFVTGHSVGTTATSNDYLTIAYQSATGTPMWSGRYDGANQSDLPHGVAVSADGTKVFVTGQSATGSFDSSDDYATVAYDASTGAEDWAQRYDSPAHELDQALGLTVAPAGTTLYVTGVSTSTISGSDFATIAYDESTGDELWDSRFDKGHLADVPTAITVAPDGSKLFVTGGASGGLSGQDYATVAYDISTGALLWRAIFDGSRSSTDVPNAIAARPDGTLVVVSGQSYQGLSNYGYVSIAYSA